MTPLEMAKNAAGAVERAAQHQEADPLGAYVGRVGERAFTAAKVAACMAVVSIAEDLHRIADVIELGPYPLEEQEAGSDPR